MEEASDTLSRARRAPGQDPGAEAQLPEFEANAGLAGDGPGLSFSPAAPAAQASGEPGGPDPLVDLLLQVQAERSRAEALAVQAQQLAARLDTTFEALTTGLILYRPDGSIDRLNAAAAAMLGYSEADIGKPLDERGDRLVVTRLDGKPLPFDERPAVRALRGEMVREVMSLRSASPDDPRSLALSVAGSPVRDANGTTVGAVVSMADVTELSQTQEKLRQANAELETQAEELEVQAEELHVQNEELARLAAQVELERARLEAVLQQMPGGVVIAEAPSGETVLSNHQVEELLRGPYRPAVGPAEYMQYDAFYPDGRPWPADEAPLTRSLCTGEVVTNEEMHVIRGDGSRAVLLLSSRPIRDAGGRIVAAVVTFVDITERKEIEEALRRAHDELEQRVQERTADLARANQGLQYQASLLANVTDAVVATDNQFRVTAWNRAAEEMYGWPAAEALGRVFGDMVPTTILGTDMEEALRTVAATRRLEIEVSQQRRDGTELIAEARVIAMKNDQGEAGGYVAVSRDVTRRKRMEEELRASEELLRQLADNVQEIFWITDRERSQMLYVSPAYETIWGRPRADLYARPASLLDSIHPDDLPQVLAGREKMPGGAFDEQYRIVRDDGSLRWIKARSFPIRNSAGEVYRIAGVAQDVTEQMQSLHLLEQRVEERTRELTTLLSVSHQLASVLQLKPLLSAILDRLLNIIEYSEAAIYQIEGDEVRVLEYRGALPREEALGLRIPLAGTVGLETVVASRRPLIIPDLQGNTPLAVAWRASPNDAQKRLVGNVCSWMAVPLIVGEQIIGLLRLDHRQPDRFSEHHAQLALAFANHAAVAMENARLYEQVEELAVVEERQRLARDLHDAVSQLLFSASLTADVLPVLWQQNPAEGERSLHALQQLTRGALAEMRALLLELRPGAMTDVDLPALLRHLADAASARLGAPVSVRAEMACQSDVCRLPEGVQVGFYRIAQETLNNVVKHARPESVAVWLSCGNGAGDAAIDGQTSCRSVRLAIVDDGRGFDAATVSGESFGLSIMRERAAAIGASLTVDSQPGHGTRVTVTWPAPGDGVPGGG